MGHSQATVIVGLDGSALDLLRTVFLQLRFDPLGQKYLHQRLVGNVVLVGKELELLEHRFGQPQGDGLCGRLQIREHASRGLRPVTVFGRSDIGVDW